MKNVEMPIFARSLVFQSGLAVALFVCSFASGPAALADDDGSQFEPGNLLVSRVV